MNRSAVALALVGLSVLVTPVAVAHAQTLVLDTGTPRFRVSISLPGRGRVRPSVRIEPRTRRSRPPATRRAPAPRARQLPPAVAHDVPAGANHDCLGALQELRVPYVPAGSVRGIDTPIEVTGPIGGVRLMSRGGRAPIMDCALARALGEAAPSMRQLGISGLSFSATYDYRVVKGTSRLSGHAHGLAIDVHALDTALGRLDVEREYPRDPGRWQARRDDAAACLGGPPTPEGRLVRGLACELRSQPAFGLIMGPDDNHDHRNHLHIEARPARSGELLSGGRSSSFQGRPAMRR